jgi:hypothetical protein
VLSVSSHTLASMAIRLMLDPVQIILRTMFFFVHEYTIPSVAQHDQVMERTRIRPGVGNGESQSETLV